MNKRAYVTAAILTAALTASVAATASASEPARVGGPCRATNVTTVDLRGAGVRETQTGTNYHGAITYHKPYILRNTDIGAPRVTITTCKNPTTGRWSVISSTFVNRFYDLRVQDYPNGKVEVDPTTDWYLGGYGIFAKGLTANRIIVEGKRCIRNPPANNWLGTAHEALGLPIPMPVAYAIGAWVLNKALPNPQSTGVHCIDLGTGEVPYTITSTGVVSASKSANSTGFAYYQQWSDEGRRKPYGEPYEFGGEADRLVVRSA